MSRLFTLITVLGVLLAMGCTAAQQPSQPAAGGEEKPRYGGTHSLAATSDPPTLDMHASNTVGTSLPVQPAMNPLVRYEPLEPTMTKVEPNLAERWDVSADGKTY